MSEYLSDAAKEVSADEVQQKKCLKKQIKLLKNNDSKKILIALEPYKDSPEENLAMQCYRYIENRPEQFNYKTALDHNLPIGSGRIEGGHRHVIQARLKISGAAWTTKNANTMLALRTNRVNDKWDDYWKTQNHGI